MPTRVLITVDTELREPRGRGETWQENFARSFDAAGVGVPHQLRLLAEHRLKACFFVDPMPALLFGPEPVRRMVDPILAAGQDVQLHLHSFWKGAADGAEPRYELSGLPFEEQLALISQARDLLVASGAPEPIAYRAGSYAADEATLDALRTLGIRYDSSHNGSHHPSPSALPLDPRRIAPVEHCGVIEVPVTQIEQGRGSLRHLQLCAVSSGEIEEALLHAAEARHPIVNLVSHSFELATRDGLRPNPILCSRFEALCAFLAEHREELPTAHFADLAGLPLDVAAEPLRPRRLRTARRMAEQIWSNARYERAL